MICLTSLNNNHITKYEAHRWVKTNLSSAEVNFGYIGDITEESYPIQYAEVYQ